MVNNSLINDEGLGIIFDRAFNSSSTFTVPTNNSFGVVQADVTTSTTSLSKIVPLLDGVTNDDGSNAFTGSSGGDNSTDNTSVFKEGGGNTDVTAQNLIANDTNADKIWVISDLSVAGTVIDGSKYWGFWLYIKDAAALAKLSAGALQVRFGSDSGNYYWFGFASSYFSVGWNWVSTNTVVNSGTESGSVGSPIDYFYLKISTNNVTDTFVAGDVVYDLLRTWSLSDTLLALDSGYPNIDGSTFNVTYQYTVTAEKGNGYPLTGSLEQNTDASILTYGISKFPSKSKSSTDRFIFKYVDRLVRRN